MARIPEQPLTSSILERATTRRTKRQIVRITFWTLFLAMLVFIAFSTTTTYRIYYHRAALRSIHDTFQKPRLNDWRSYNPRRILFWFLDRNSNLQEKMEQTQYHQQELLKLGFLEKREFSTLSNTNRNQGVSAKLNPLIKDIWTPETTLTVTDMSIGVVAPALHMDRWQTAIATISGRILVTTNSQVFPQAE